MAKLNQLILLEKMMGTYDEMNIKDANLTKFQGACTEKLVDEIIDRLEKMVVSKTRLSSRNVLLANYETMTKTTHWLGCKLFRDLPRAASKVLQEKVKKMVELLNMLMLKILNVDEQYAATFFRKLKEGYGKKRITEYELWKARLPELTMDLLEAYQVQLTANMLSSGILEYANDPNGEDVQNVEKLRKYMFQYFGMLTHEQHIAMFEYDVQLKMIHEDIEKVMPLEEEEEIEIETEDPMEYTIGYAAKTMRAEGELKHLYDYTWLMMLMNETDGLPSFDTPTSYVDYMKQCGVKSMPTRSNISKYYDKARGEFPNWTFSDADGQEAKRRNNVAKRFLNLVRSVNNSH